MNKTLQWSHEGATAPEKFGLAVTMHNKKAQLTQGLRATAPSFQDGGCPKMADSRHLRYY